MRTVLRTAQKHTYRLTRTHTHTHMASKRCPTCNTVKPLSAFANKGKHTYCRDCMRTRNLQSTYGLTQPQLASLRALQNETCPICKEPLPKVPHVDHSHVTGVVRGLLCRSCNTGLGLFRDSPQVLMAAATYLLSFEANAPVGNEVHVAAAEAPTQLTQPTSEYDLNPVEAMPI